jgi:hypothetical protein
MNVSYALFLHISFINRGVEMTMLKLGWKAGPEQYPPKEMLEYAIVVENAGFDSIDVSDHFHPHEEEYWAGSFLPALFNQKIYTPGFAAKNGRLSAATL